VAKKIAKLLPFEIKMVIGKKIFFYRKIVRVFYAKTDK